MDRLTLRRGVTRFSSPDWRVRMFVAAPGVELSRDDAPELRHAGLFLALGAGAAHPVTVTRHLPLFGDAAALPPHAAAGGLFLTTSADELEAGDLAILGAQLFGGPAHGVARAPEAVALCAQLFLQVMSDAYHDRAA